MPYDGQEEVLKVCPSQIRSGWIHLTPFTFDYTPGALTEVHGKKSH